MKKHDITIIPFSTNHIQTLWLKNVEKYFIEDKTIVINLGNHNTKILEYPNKYLLPRTSTILKEVNIANADSLLLIRIIETTNIGGVILDSQWNQLGEISNYPKNIPLWRSPQFDLGIVHFNPYIVTELPENQQKNQIKKYQVKVNLWFAPANTNCGIHNHHTIPEFLEVHTQIYGTGRMQKFRDNTFTTLYQDDMMSQGISHKPYASIDNEGNFFYPWHQYFAETDCIWIANEFHPID